MSTSLTKLNYARLARGVTAIIERGQAEAKKALQRQILQTNWEVGRYLSNNLPRTTGQNGIRQIIKPLAGLTGRDEIYFYLSLKFYRVYPVLPKDVPDWTWTHFRALLSVNDPKKRERFEQVLRKKWMNSMQFNALVLMEKKAEQAQIPVVKAAEGPARLQPVRGKLYHYYLAGPKKNETNTGFVTVDAGFNILRDIPADKRIKYQAGMIVRTEENPGLAARSSAFAARISASGARSSAFGTRSSASGARSPASAVQAATRIFSPKRSKTSPADLYTYKARVARVIDGDTLECEIDLGLYTKTVQKLRLRGINAPEMSTPRGFYVKDRVKKILDKQDFVVVKTYKDDKYGRMLADVFYQEKLADPQTVADEGIFLNQQLLDQGLAEVWTE